MIAALTAFICWCFVQPQNAAKYQILTKVSEFILNDLLWKILIQHYFVTHISSIMRNVHGILKYESHNLRGISKWYVCFDPFHFNVNKRKVQWYEIPKCIEPLTYTMPNQYQIIRSLWLSNRLARKKVSCVGIQKVCM